MPSGTLCCGEDLCCCVVTYLGGWGGGSGGRSFVGYVILKVMGIATSGSHNDVGYFNDG